MKKLDKLILLLFIRYFSFALPFVLLLLTMQRIISYFPRFVGKGLGIFVFVKLFSYLMINAIFYGMPLAIMLASLMTYGNLGEHSELTAIKAAGISLLRLLQPTFLLTLGFVAFSFLLNAYFTPQVNLKMFTLLYDITHKKPSFQLEEKEFYEGIPGYTIRVEKKYPDNRTFQYIMIYDHSSPQNHRIILADSCLMYTEDVEGYLRLELFSGYYYVEQKAKGETKKWDYLVRTQFKKMDLHFNLSSFDFTRSHERNFSHVRFTKNVSEVFLKSKQVYAEITDIQRTCLRELLILYSFRPKDSDIHPSPKGLAFGARRERTDTATDKGHTGRFDQSFSRNDSLASQGNTHSITALEAQEDLSVEGTFERIRNKPPTRAMRKNALKHIQELKASIVHHAERLKSAYKSFYRYEIEAYRRLAFAFSCLSMYLIGAPLGTIIKRGGLGLPLIISTLFCIKFYVVNTLFEKYAREGLMSTFLAAWLPNVLLFTIGFFLLWLSIKDSHILEFDRYRVFLQHVLKRIKRLKTS